MTGFVGASTKGKQRALAGILDDIMGAFRDQLGNIVSQGEVVNTLFEEHLCELVSIVHRIAGALSGECPANCNPDCGTFGKRNDHI